MIIRAFRLSRQLMLDEFLPTVPLLKLSPLPNGSVKNQEAESMPGRHPVMYQIAESSNPL